jgi:hypothetical protein
MRPARVLALAIPAVAGTALLGGAAHRWSAVRDEQRTWEAIAATARPAVRFEPAMLHGLPEPARRYLSHAIAPGTLLRTTVELEMRGTFLLGNDGASATPYTMTARQILAPPNAFVWRPQMRSGPMIVSGSDGLHEGEAWTRFWLMGLVPVADVRSSGSDLVRSAAFRSAMEGIWAPASLLPQNGAAWREQGPDRARVTVQTTGGPVTLDLTLAPDGRLIEIVGQRWSNANPRQSFRWQPFGGTMEAEATVNGFTIPSRVKIGNHYGTPDYLPFFQVELTSARYL